MNVITDENGNEITIPNPALRQEVRRLQEALYRLTLLNSRTRFHQERVNSYVEQTNTVAQEIQLSLNSLKGHLSTGLAYSTGIPGTQIATDLSTAYLSTETSLASHEDAPELPTYEDGSESNSVPEAPMSPIHDPTPEDLYMDDEFDELARTVELTPGGCHVRLPVVNSELHEADASNCIAPVEVKNKHFYNKHRADILDSRRQKRELDYRLQEQFEHEQRRQKQRQAKKTKSAEKTAQLTQPTEVDPQIQHPTCATLVSESSRYVEDRLQQIQACYEQQVKADPQCYAEKLCQDSLRWKKRTRSPIAPRETPISPTTIDRECFQTMLDEFQRLTKEYFVLFKGEGWADWDERWASMMGFEETLAKMIETLALIEVELEMGEEMPTLEDLTLIFDIAKPTKIHGHEDWQRKTPITEVSFDILLHIAFLFLRLTVRYRQSGVCKCQRKDGEDLEKRQQTEDVVEEDKEDEEIVGDDELLLQSGSNGDDVEWEITETPEQIRRIKLTLSFNLSYFRTRISTIKGEMDRLLQQNPRQYFEHIMAEIFAWKKAGQPTLSPHYIAVDTFHAQESVLETMRHWMLNTLGPVYHSIQIYDLWRLAHWLAHSASEIGQAIGNDEKLGPNEKLEYWYANSLLRFQSDWLLTLYDNAGLSPRDDTS
ncbi:hypothetical protein V5O48_017145 [Marasmius crinis-equi]|uniref:Uncharacterized protein n=1 Tax=Marasmius crinis-equi TaxID=585013 RepID=A0ABR3EPT7_9AGAR